MKKNETLPVTVKIGKLAKLKYTMNVSGGGNNSEVSTNHVYMFEVNGTWSKITSSSPVHLSNGDELAVAGLFANGELNASAYKNLTTGHTHMPEFVQSYVGAILLLAISGFVYFHDRNGFGSGNFRTAATAFAVVMLLSGLMLLFVGRHAQRSHSALNAALRERHVQGEKNAQ